MYDEAIQTSNVGYISALEANYGYRDNIQIIQTDEKVSLPAYSHEEVAARAKATESLPGGVENLPG